MRESRAFLIRNVCLGFIGCYSAHGRLGSDGSNTIRQLILSSDPNNTVAHQYIVQFSNDDLSDEEIEKMAAKTARQTGGTILWTYKYAFKGVALTDIVDVGNLDYMLHSANFGVIEQDELIVLDPITEQESRRQSTRKLNRGLEVQNDAVPRGLDRIDQVSLPLDGQYSHRLDGSGVNVYVVDTGLRATHKDFRNATNCGFDLYDVFYNNVNASIARDRCVDGLDHGTHVAGTVAGSISGVAKNVNLISVSVFDARGRGTRTSVVLGIDYVIGQKQANPDVPMVINLSLSGEYSRLLNDMVDAAVDAGIVVVAAAGNDNRNACRYSPGSSRKAITVGASSLSRLFRKDRRAFTSNYGNCVDIFAPGNLIVSTASRNDDTFEAKSGTSMAAPHVTGAVALYLQRDPTLTPAQVRDALLNDASSGQLMRIFHKSSPNKLLYTGNI